MTTPEDEDFKLQPDTILSNGYCLVEVRGQGAFGIVYKAQKDGQAPVALKIFRGRHHRRSYEKERENLQRVTDKLQPSINVVRLVEGFIDEQHLSCCCLVMAPLARSSLQGIITIEPNSYDLATIHRWGLDIAMALRAMHRAGLVHLDVNPRNVLVGEDGHAYLGDLGIATYNHPYGLQETELECGKYSIMSVAPEMKDGDRKFDDSSETWSWGLVLYALLSRSLDAFDHSRPLEDGWTFFLNLSARSDWGDGLRAAWPPEVEGLLDLLPACVCHWRDRLSLVTVIDCMSRLCHNPLPQEELSKHELTIVLSELALRTSPNEEARADAYHAKARGHEKMDEQVKAELSYRRAIDALQGVSSSTKDKHAETWMGLAQLLADKGEYEESLVCFEEALDMMRRTYPSDHPHIATCLNAISVLHKDSGRYELAVHLCQQALDMRRRVLPADHLDTSVSLHDLAAALYYQGDYDQALQLYQESLDMKRRLLPPDDPDIAAATNDLGSLLYAMGDFQATVPLFEEALGIQRKILPPEHEEIAVTMSNLAVVYKALGQLDKALPLYQESLDMTRRRLPPDHPEVATSVNNLGGLYLACGDYEQALELCLEALDMRRRVLDPNHRLVAASLQSISAIYKKKGDYTLALSYCQEALDMMKQCTVGEHPDLAVTMDNLANIHMALGDVDLALGLCQDALAMRRRVLPGDHIEIASSLHNLAVLHHHRGEDQLGLPLCDEAVVIMTKALPSTHPTLQAMRNTRDLLASGQ